jgi:AcrR family transcriptional regulator
MNASHRLKLFNMAKNTRSLSKAKRDRARKKMISVAKKLFFKTGYVNTTMDEIAQKAGISKGAIYLHFDNKADLFVSLMIPSLNKLGEMLADFEENLPQCKNGKEMIQRFFEIHKKFYEFDPDAVKIIQAYQQGDFFLAIRSTANEKFNKIARNNFNISRRVIKNAQKMGILAKEDPFGLADVIWATFLGVTSLEESKKYVTKREHLFPTMQLAFSLLARGLEVANKFVA